MGAFRRVTGLGNPGAVSLLEASMAAFPSIASDPDLNLRAEQGGTWFFRRLSQARNRDLNPLDANRARELAFWLYQTNALGARILEITRDYVLGEGVDVTAADTGAIPKDAIQQVLDDFREDNDWDAKLHQRVLDLGIFGEQCVAGDTEVETLTGRQRIDRMTFPAWVYGYSQADRRWTLERATVGGKTGNKPCVRIRALRSSGDGEDTLVCTADHKVMLIDGTYREATKLSPGDRLMSLYVKERKGRRQLYPSGKTAIMAYHFVASEQLGPRPPGALIHHRNHDKRDDRPENLVYLTASEHAAHHMLGKWASGILPGPLPDATAVSAVLAQRNRDWWARSTPEARAARIAAVRSGTWGDETKRQRQRAALRAYASDPLVRRRLGDSRRNWCAAHPPPPRIAKPKAGRWSPEQRRAASEFKRKWWASKSAQERSAVAAGINHTVISVEDAGVRAVYNLNVEKIHNFVANGIVVKNCMPVAINPKDGSVRLGLVDPAAIRDVMPRPYAIDEAGQVVLQQADAADYRVKVVERETDPTDPWYWRWRDVDRDSATGDVTETWQALDARGLPYGDPQPYVAAAFYWAVNRPSTARRGIGDLYRLVDWVDAYDQLLFGEVDRVNMLRAFIWDVTVKGASEQQITEFRKKNPIPKPGSIRYHNENVEYKAATPALNGSDTQAELDPILSLIATGAGAAKTWLGGIMDVNRASAVELAEPAFKRLSERQRVIVRYLTAVYTFALDQAEIAGRLPRRSAVPGGIKPIPWAFVVTMPELVKRDLTTTSQMLQYVSVAVSTLIADDVIDVEAAQEIFQTAAASFGVDINLGDMRTRLEAAKAERERKQAEMVTRTAIQPSDIPAVPPAADAVGVPSRNGAVKEAVAADDLRSRELVGAVRALEAATLAVVARGGEPSQPIILQPSPAAPTEVVVQPMGAEVSEAARRRVRRTIERDDRGMISAIVEESVIVESVPRRTRKVVERDTDGMISGVVEEQE